MGSNVLSFFYSLVLLTCLATYGHGGGPVREHLVSIQSLLPSNVCSSAKDLAWSTSNATRLSLVHMHGPCSPLGRRESLSPQQILDGDRARIDMLHRRMITASDRRKERPQHASKIPASTGSLFGSSEYVVTLGFGTPKKDQTVNFDTGSDVSWIQCQPCASVCYKQREAIFDPSKSATYTNVSCTSAYCSELDDAGCSSATCQYRVKYDDNSYSEGFFAQDTLTLASGDVIPDFRFGCGQNNQGLFDQTAGLLGLDREKASFISQTYHKYGGVFAYCFPSTSSSTGYLAFGSGSYPAANVKFTPMLSEESTPSSYYVNLTGISVGRQRLSVPRTLFSVGGTIIDSGTVVTRLPPTAYSALRSSFRKLMSRYKRAPRLRILDTCYDFTGHNSVKVPAVALHFGGGVTMKLDKSGIFFTRSLSQTCLAFVPNGADSDLVIIGSVQQRKFSVLYDLSKKVIGFSHGGC